MIFSAPEFIDFVEQSSKILQRALSDGYDYIRDYTVGTETGPYVASTTSCSCCLPVLKRRL